MEIRDLAQAVLLSADLATKLARPEGPLTDDAPGAPLDAVPAAPGRPTGLSLAAEGTPPVPSLRALERDPAQGPRVLHALANHELLAMELMALTLLRFPDAPPAFRRGVAHTLLEEQEHLRLYLARLQAAGSALGDFPLSAFFWTHLREVPSPRAYVAAMSLTLEQANLDHALAARRSFAAIGDADTAAVLERVLADEIGHVAHGARWLARWKEADESEWDAYRRWLPAPFTPARAKGEPFARAPREAAGLSPQLIAQVEAFAASRGRPPRVFLFNPGCEAELAERREGPGPAIEQDLARDLAPLLAVVAEQDDLALVPAVPGAEHLATLRRLGLARAEVRAVGPAPLPGDVARAVSEEVLGGLQPWGWSPRTAALLAPLAERARRSGWPLEHPGGLEVVREVASKTFAAQVLADALRDPPRGVDVAAVRSAVCRAPAEAAAALDRLANEGWGWAVLKAPWGTSGRGQRRVPLPARDDPALARWLETTLRRQGAVVAAPWLERVADLSLLLDVGGAQTRARVRRAFCDRRGQYRGHLLGRRLHLDPAGERLLHAEGGLATLRAVAEQARAALADRGYRGPVGIDALLFRRGETLAVHPLVEINPRLTMGRVAVAAEGRLTPGSAALFLLLGAADLRSAGASSFAALAARLAAALPLRTAHGKVQAGAVCLTDPAQARVSLAVLAVGPSWQDVRGALERAGVAAP